MTERAVAIGLAALACAVPAVTTASACSHGASGSSGAGPSASAGASAGVPGAGSPRAAAMLEAEQRRVAAHVTDDDLRSRDVEVRRGAVRALARTASPASHGVLVRALADEDPDVVAWAAHGVGATCAGHAETAVAALVAQAVARPELGSASVAAGAGAGAKPRRERAGALDAASAVARAVGACGGPAAEATLVAWLAAPGPRAVAAAFALGDVAGAQKKLREETLVAMLTAASGSASAPPVPEALFAVSRIESVPPSVTDRLLEVATARLATPGPARIFAVKALGRAGEGAVATLARALGQADAFAAAERAEAARQLGRLGARGKDALGAAIAALAPTSDAIALGGLAGDDLGPLLVAIEALEPKAGNARGRNGDDDDAPPAWPRAGSGSAATDKTLKLLASLAVPAGAPAPVRLRASWVRCAAARVIAPRDDDPALVACDVSGAQPAQAQAGQPAPLPSGLGARALLAVLAREAITGPRLALFKRLALEGDLRAREAALELLGAHDEVTESAALLTAALASPEPGVAATAAQVIADHPLRAQSAAKAKTRVRKASRKKKRGARLEAAENAAARDDEPDAALAVALVDALKRGTAAAPGARAADPELLGALAAAAGSLRLAQAKAELEAMCASSWPALRERAAKSLSTLATKKITCDAPAAGGELPPEWPTRVARPTRVELETDAGAMALELDASVAPLAVSRVVDLARAGFYDGMIVHRVVPGFVTQLGAPSGDGFGGPEGRAPLRCETSPIAFEALSVGVALSGRDTGSSQIFVTHAAAPHLDGKYAWIGTATGPWASFVDGDRVLKAKVAAP